MTPAPSPSQTGQADFSRRSDDCIWVINGMPRSGQQQMAKRLAHNTGAPPALLQTEDDAGRPAWSIDKASAERAYAGLKPPVGGAPAGHSVLCMTSPLLAPAAPSGAVPIHHIHMVRDPRQLFTAYARRPQLPDLVRLARVVADAGHLPQLQPLWDGGIADRDMLTQDDDALRVSISASDASRFYGMFFYLWMLSLLRNLRNGALCIELRTLATSSNARADLIELFANFGLKVGFEAGRIDKYAASDIANDLGLPTVPWGSNLAHELRGSNFALVEARVSRQLEEAADKIDLWIEEDNAAALTSFIDPAYGLILLPFVRPWFASKEPEKRGSAQNASATSLHK